MDRDRLNGFNLLCTALVFFTLAVWPLSDLFSSGLWPILTLLGILVMTGSGFSMLLWPSRYGEDHLSGLQLGLIFGGTSLALLGTLVHVFL